MSRFDYGMLHDCSSLIDVSEVRMKLSLETAPAQRPHEILGVWSPILSAVGNAFKIQVGCHFFPFFQAI